ncbi:MAG: redox-sensing transcriptional repressor Rex [Planctomycetota bacterium]
MPVLTIPKETIKRLFLYYRALLESRQTDFISSEELAKLTGSASAQIRKDLTYFGEFGTPGKGYRIEELSQQIKNILGIDRDWEIILAGVGNVGRALLSYQGLKTQGFKITYLFDNDPEKIGKTCAGLKINDIKMLKDEIQDKNIKMAVVAVPANSAHEVVNILVDAGIKAIINFAPTFIFAPRAVRILNIDITNELARLSYYLSNPVTSGKDDFPAPSAPMDSDVGEWE